MIIYFIQNIVNLKMYVGKHEGDNPWDRWPYDLRRGDPNPHLLNSYKKYGPDAFVRGILDYCLCKEDLNELERFWIRTLETYKPEVGYNQTLGGEGGVPTEETKHKIKVGVRRAYDSGRLVPHNRGKSNVEVYGKEKAEELSKKLSKAKKGKCSPKRLQHILHVCELNRGKRGGMAGKHLSDEQKQHLREVFTGKKHTTNSIELMSQKAKERWGGRTSEERHLILLKSAETRRKNKEHAV